MVKPALDHYIGRICEAVLVNKADWQWSIELTGGVLINNKDEERDLPPDGIVGKAFSLVTFSELDTTMKFTFGDQDATEVVLTAVKYTIASPDYDGGEYEVYPQRPEELEDTLPPDPSADRVADGPTGPEEGSESDGETTNG